MNSFNQKIKTKPLTIIEAHDGLSAKIAEHYNFDAIWASGFAISTTFGLRDCDELFPSDLINTVRVICEASSLNVIVDGSTGYGHFNQARMLAKSMWRAGASAICFEDKPYPKMNSYRDISNQLVSVKDFSAKIKSSKDITHGELYVIARTEALILRLGLQEALNRANAYVEAGADAIFIHSSASHADEIVEFTKLFRKDIPLFISPTSYVTDLKKIKELNRINGIIWANQLIRAATFSMSTMAKQLKELDYLALEKASLSSMQDIFDFLDYQELANAEKRYLE